MSTSEVKMITTLQNEVKNLSEKNNQLKKELEHCIGNSLSLLEIYLNKIMEKKIKNKFIKIYNDLDIKNKTTRELYNFILVIKDEIYNRDLKLNK